MQENVFQDCLQSWTDNKNSKKSIWIELAKKWGFDSAENLRCKFKSERKKRGIDSTGRVEVKDSVAPRIAVLDIETLPAEVYTFGFYDQNIGIDQVISDVSFLSWAAKFLNEPEMYSDILTSKEAPVKNDKRITKSCWNFLSKVDVLIGHNVCAFDSKLMNTFFLKHDLPPLKYAMIDTLTIARANFRFSSNKLSFLNRQLGIIDKIANDGFPLWRDCHKGIQSSLDTMLEYNLGDILATESLFYKIRPYIRNFNFSLYNETDTLQCPVCGSTNLKVEGYMYSGTSGKYESVRCLDCKAISRKKENLLTKSKKKNMLTK